MKPILSFGLLLFVADPSHAAGPVFDVLAIAGKTKQQVSGELGKPQSCGTSKYGEKCSYAKGETEIVFINGKADWITIEAMDQVNYSGAAITSLGFKAAKPTLLNNFTIRWESIQGIKEVSVFPVGSVVGYAYVKVSTK